MDKKAGKGGNKDVEPLLTPAEVAELFRVNPKTVTRWARAGKITAVRTPPPAVPQGRDRGAAALRTLHRRLNACRTRLQPPRDGCGGLQRVGTGLAAVGG